MSLALEVAEIRDAAEVVTLELEWWELWRRSPLATPFQAPAWLMPWWRAFNPGELLIITFRASGRLVGLAPFYISERTILQLGDPVSDYLDMLADPEYVREVANALAEHLVGTSIPWSRWEMTELPPGAAARTCPCPSLCQEESEVCSYSPVLDLPEHPVSVQQLLPLQRRRALRKSLNRASRRGIEFITADIESASSFLDLLIELHGARWESREQRGELADPRLQRFHGEAVPLLMKAGIVRLSVLRIGGKPAAASYCFLHRHRSYGYMMGFDPEFAHESPGALLVACSVGQAMREGAREFDFLRGQESYKYEWGAKDRANLRRVFMRYESSDDAL